MAVLRTRLRQIGRASLNMGQCRQRRIPTGNGVEAAAPLVRFAPPGRLDRIPRSVEQRLTPRRNEILIEERDGVVARIALSADEPRVPVEGPLFGGQQFGSSSDVISTDASFNVRAQYSGQNLLAPKAQRANLDAAESDLTNAEAVLRSIVQDVAVPR